MQSQTQDQDRYTLSMGFLLLRELANENHFIFTIDEAKSLASRLRASENCLAQLLPRLVNNGLLIRLRRGLYAGAGVLGDIHVHPFAIATSLVTPSAISHWSAMNYHGLTEQIPQTVTAFTPKKVVTPSMRDSEKQGRTRKHTWEVEGVRCEYVSVKREHFFGSEEVWVDQMSKVKITDRERTMLEGFISPHMFGGMGEVLGILNEHAHELNLKKMVNYALQYGKASVVKRLGWGLEQVGVTGDDLIPLERMPISGFRMLDPTGPHRGPCDKHWMIQNNLSARSV